MKTVDQLIDDVLRREGGAFTNLPQDKGGATRWGITRATLARARGQREVPVSDVQRLTEAEAREIYRELFWRAPHLDHLPARLQPLLFDWAVNSGPGVAVKALQDVVNQASFGPLAQDGVVGPETIAAAQAADAAMCDWLTAALVEERRGSYHAIVGRDPSQERFLRGWLNRLVEFEVDMDALRRAS